jgi:hypothetical protein
MIEAVWVTYVVTTMMVLPGEVGRVSFVSIRKAD